MSRLLEQPPYAPRSEADFLDEMNALSRHHQAGCPAYARVWPDPRPAATIEDLPFLHVGVFKHVEFKTTGESIRHERTLKSSATSGTASSRIPLDAQSSRLQAQSTTAILTDFIGSTPRPLLVLDASKSLLQRGEVSARIAAAMSLRPMAGDIAFLLDDAENPGSMNWERLRCMLESRDELLVYGFTWILWLAWGASDKPEAIRELLTKKRIDFVHSGGWKKLERLQVDRRRFDAALLRSAAPGSRVLDFYGLVEQVGVIYPLCSAGRRHVPAWADVVVRDPFTLQPRTHNEPGMLQLLNTLAWGAPYHCVLTEDVGKLLAGPCPCGRAGRTFDLLGRVPNAEVRGCANV